MVMAAGHQYISFGQSMYVIRAIDHPSRFAVGWRLRHRSSLPPGTGIPVDTISVRPGALVIEHSKGCID